MRYYWERLKEHIGNLMGTHWEQTKKPIFGYDICTSRVITWKAKKKGKEGFYLALDPNHICHPCLIFT